MSNQNISSMFKGFVKYDPVVSYKDMMQFKLGEVHEGLNKNKKEELNPEDFEYIDMGENLKVKNNINVN